MSNAKKPVTARKLINALGKYQEQLYNDKKVSRAKYYHMGIALYGAKCIIRDAFGLSRKRENAKVK